MKLPDVNPKSAIAMMLTATVCLVILAFITGSLFYPPNTINEVARAKIFELLTFILGVVSGYLLKDGTNPPLPPKTPETK